MATVKCGKCGALVDLPEHSSFGCGMSISKESKGDFTLNMLGQNTQIKTTEYGANVNKNTKENKTMGMTKEEERQAILKATGIDISKYFNVASNEEVDVVADEVTEEIYANGYVKNTKLHRRWVMAQMFRMINSNSRWHDDGFNEALARKGYMYQFEMLLEELRVQDILFRTDKETFEERNSFFNKGVAVALARDFRRKLEIRVGRIKPKNCKGVPYITYRGRNIFVSDINKKIYRNIDILIYRLETAGTPNGVYECFKNFVKVAKKNKLAWRTQQCSEWVDAYKGAGGYYTLRNMVQFHGCKLNKYRTNEYVTGVDAVKYLESTVDEYSGDGWRYLAMLRKCIADNDFHFGN